MPRYAVRTDDLRALAVRFRDAAGIVETSLTPVRQSGIEPASRLIFGSDDSASQYNEASQHIAAAVVQLTSSLHCIEQKLTTCADLYDAASASATIRSQ